MATDPTRLAQTIERRLSGGKIVQAIVSRDKKSVGFQVEAKDGRLLNVWVDSDPEGKSPGFLKIAAVNQKA